MRPLIRGFVILGLLWLEFILYRNVNRHDAGGDSTGIVVGFASIIGVALVIGAVVAFMVLPSLGEAVGNFFFNPGGEIEKSPYSPALAKIAVGDYEGAIREYHAILKENPEDMHAVSEIVHIYCDKLGDHDTAEKFLTDALQSEWPADQGAFIASKLVDVYWNHKRDAESARHVLNQIAESMPDTRHSANAVHRLNEIERALAGEAVDLTLHARPDELPDSADEASGGEEEQETPKR